MDSDIELSQEITQIVKDIEDLKIQGATAVAENSFRGIKLFLEGYTKMDVHRDVFLSEVEKVGLKLVKARPNEPLARNGLKYLLNNFKIKHPDDTSIEDMRVHLTEIMDDFIKLLSDAKSKIVEQGVGEFKGINGLMTHCHSSTVENVIKGIVATKKEEEWFTIIATETRPRYQGRITVKNLADAGIESLMIVDGAVTSFLAGDWKASDISGDWGDWDVPVEAVFIGCDQINVGGDTINKVGSYGIALSAYSASKPLYVVGTILKLDPSSIYDRPKIEMRKPEEVWKDAPESVRIINPAFEIVPHQYITGFVTEFGILKPEEVEKALGDNYDWMY